MIVLAQSITGHFGGTDFEKYCKRRHLVEILTLSSGAVVLSERLIVRGDAASFLWLLLKLNIDQN